MTHTNPTPTQVQSLAATNALVTARHHRFALIVVCILIAAVSAVSGAATNLQAAALWPIAANPQVLSLSRGTEASAAKAITVKDLTKLALDANGAHLTLDTSTLGASNGSIKGIGNGSSADSGAGSAQQFNLRTYIPNGLPLVIVADAVSAEPIVLNDDEVIVPRFVSGVDQLPLLGSQVTAETTQFVAPGQGTGFSTTLRIIGVYDANVSEWPPPTWFVNAATANKIAAHAQFTSAEAAPGNAVNPNLSANAAIMSFAAGTSDAQINDVRSTLTAQGYKIEEYATEFVQLQRVAQNLTDLQWGGYGLLTLLYVVYFGVILRGMRRMRGPQIRHLQAQGVDVRDIKSIFRRELMFLGAGVALAGLVIGFLGTLLGNQYANALRENAAMTSQGGVLTFLLWGILVIAPLLVALGATLRLDTLIVQPHLAPNPTCMPVHANAPDARQGSNQ